MKSFFALSLLALAFPALAGQGAYGTWKLPAFDQGGLQIVSTMTIAQGTVSSTAVCTMNGQSATVSVSSPATITESEITVIGEAHQAVSVNGVDCNASISPMTMQYSVSADDQSMTLSAQDQSFTVSRQ